MHSSGRTAVAQPKRHAGFTLIELMVVILILGVLAALVVPRVMSRPDEARVIAAKQDIARIMQSLQLYRLDNSRYPTTEQGLQALVTRPTTSPVPNNWKSYLDKVPNDPWGRP
ncbi:MAG TPA: type II secretion system major pseudopilin GspG, partial [Burkholderiaceae bacterium]|nr:type II secretion system major pseudopilin GspG [Burkholderiaceae bacterium]